MPIDRELWSRLVTKHTIPNLPCPRCDVGKLHVHHDSVRIDEPMHSKAARRNNEQDWEPTWSVSRWSATLVCDRVPCGEIVNLLGDTDVVDSVEFNDDGTITQLFHELLCIRAVFPAPKMIKMSKEVPVSVSTEVYQASKMYWMDTAACITRLRTAVECLLDEQNVPKSRMHKGRVSPMTLYHRIESFANGAVHREQLDGLRHIGNLGTHSSGSVDNEDLFDALDVLEHVLIGIYDSKAINAKAKRLSAKGKQKPDAA